MVDGVTAQLYTFTAANGGTSDFCGNPTPVTDSINTSFNDLIVAVSFTIPHSASTLTIKIISNLVSSSGSWGIRDMMITMAACDESCLTCTTGSKPFLNQLLVPPVMLGKDSLFLVHFAYAVAGIDRGIFLAQQRLAQFAWLEVAQTDCNHAMI